MAVTYKTLDYKLKNNIGILTLNLPKKLNAHTKEMRQELLHFWKERIIEENGCKVIILTGAGSSFCSGGDINEIDNKKIPIYKKKMKEIYIYQNEMSDVIFFMRKAPQPIIGAIRGYALGGGFSLAMACDIRIADYTAKFGASYINIGLSGADMGSTFFLPKEINLGFAAEYLYTGEIMDAKVARKIGFVNYLVPSKKLIPKALELANKMVKKSILSLRMTKETLNQNIGAISLDSALHLENRCQVICLSDGPIINPLKVKTKLKKKNKNCKE